MSLHRFQLQVWPSAYLEQKGCIRIQRCRGWWGTSPGPAQAALLHLQPLPAGCSPWQLPPPPPGPWAESPPATGLGAGKGLGAGGGKGAEVHQYSHVGTPSCSC